MKLNFIHECIIESKQFSLLNLLSSVKTDTPSEFMLVKPN